MLRGIAFVARRELTLIARHPALALLTTILPLVLLAIPSVLIGFFTAGPMLFGTDGRPGVDVGKGGPLRVQRARHPVRVRRQAPLHRRTDDGRRAREETQHLLAPDAGRQGVHHRDHLGLPLDHQAGEDRAVEMVRQAEQVQADADPVWSA